MEELETITYDRQRAILADNQKLFQRMFEQARYNTQAHIDAGDMTAKEGIWFMYGNLEAAFGVNIKPLVDREV